VAQETLGGISQRLKILNLLLMILKTLSAKFMIGTAGQARMDACKGGSRPRS
jgi:hypothetical protein